MEIIIKLNGLHSIPLDVHEDWVEVIKFLESNGQYYKRSLVTNLLLENYLLGGIKHQKPDTIAMGGIGRPTARRGHPEDEGE